MFLNKEVLLNTFGDLPQIIEEYFKNIAEETLDIKRSENAWTIREHLYHIVSVQEMLYQRILKIENEERPVITPYFPEKDIAEASLFVSIEEAFSKYKAIREKQIVLIKHLSEQSFKKEAQHGEYVRYNIPIIINHMVFHEYWHMYRIEELWLTRDLRD